MAKFIFFIFILSTGFTHLAEAQNKNTDTPFVQKTTHFSGENTRKKATKQLSQKTIYCKINTATSNQNHTHTHQKKENHGKHSQTMVLQKAVSGSKTNNLKYSRVKKIKDFSKTNVRH